MAERDSAPGATLADKGYDNDAIRQDLCNRGTAQDIPTKGNRKVQHSVGKRLYALRSRIECRVGHLKEQWRIATRYGKTTGSFLGFALLGCILLWIRFVHRALEKLQIMEYYDTNLVQTAVQRHVGRERLDDSGGKHH
jgi:IS5 family transposase